MLGVDAGSTDIDGFIEGLLDGPTLFVGTSLGVSLGDTDCVVMVLVVRDGPIDSDGNSLGSVLGVRLTLGAMLVCETDNVGSILGLKDGLIDSEGNELFSVVGAKLKLGPMLGVDAGSTEIDVFIEGPLDGPPLCVGTSLGVSLGDTDCV
eukprot:scaffold46631_cov44-Attheya_sp.AAC.1